MSFNAPPLEILLATYNGAQFLEAQLDSVLAQTHTRWALLARDDESTDGTRAILEQYAARHPDRVRVLPANGRRLGAMGNFSELLSASTAEHVMFCDQDDVWLPEKIEVTLARMQAAEAKQGAVRPVLVHTDLRVVDEALRPIADSMWRFQQTNPARLAMLPRALLQNFVTGCTAMVNRALLAEALPIPREARMHDWWLALVALAFGVVESVPTATILYRQHGKNERGAKAFNPVRAALEMIDRERWRATSEVRWAEFRRQETQAAAFFERFRERLEPRAQETLQAFARLSRQGALARRASIVRHGFFYSSPVTTLGMLLFR
jgi:glycosyltransferase involved in cell wall biosynthesis